MWRTLFKVWLGLSLIYAFSYRFLQGRLEPENAPVSPPTQVDLPALPTEESYYQGEMAGEASRDSIILQARLTTDGQVKNGDVTGKPGIGAFALSLDEKMREFTLTPWQVATADNDYILKFHISGLQPGRRYYYRLVSGADIEHLKSGPLGRFSTWGRSEKQQAIRFMAVTSLNEFAFQAQKTAALAWEDLRLGFPALETILNNNPDFVVFTGDNVYYDTPFIGRAQTLEAMRAKWHRQFAKPRFSDLFLNTVVYFQKDDHDYRYEDADPYGDFLPTGEMGSRVFIEQVPVVAADDPGARTYRTYQVNSLLQFWLLESREYRDANTDPPGADKSMWGAEQFAWLKRTLLESQAVFKIIISPTPLVGPDDTQKGVQGGFLAPYFGGKPLGQGDDMRKRDNHLNALGFKDEGDAFFTWLVEQGFLGRNLYILCGDRHWQYHSIHPTGFQEFSVGALIDGSSRLGPKPGDPDSTDPQGLVAQVYTQQEASGGFLQVDIHPQAANSPAAITFRFFDERGEKLYEVTFPAQ